MNKTKIEYLDYTWNPIVGCSGVGCAVAGACWAKGQAKRQKPGVDKNGRDRGCQDCYDFKPHLHAGRLIQPFTAAVPPSRIGVCFMGDLFDDKVQVDWTQRIFETMQLAGMHTFICLTKQAHNLVRKETPKFPRNVWMGVSVNRVCDTERIDYLRRCGAAVKFVSFEPLFEDVSQWWQGLPCSRGHFELDLSGIDWIIIGAQKRPDVQPKKKWVANLIQAADRAGCKIFMKNNLACRVELEYALNRGFEEIPEVKRHD
jgi:protein gp37